MKFSVDVKLVYALSSLQSRIHKRMDAALSIHGISFTEHQVLKSLHSAPKYMMRRVELANTIGLTASGVTRLLLPMEKIGLVTKEINQRDARVSLVKLTKAGKSLFINTETTLDQATESIFGALKENQKNALLNSIELVL